MAGADHPAVTDIAQQPCRAPSRPGSLSRRRAALQAIAGAIREKALGPDHPDVTVSLNNLALRYDNQGRYADAEPLYERSPAIREKALGTDQVAQSLNNPGEGELAGPTAADGRDHGPESVAFLRTEARICSSNAASNA
jgi:hypothetical protein